MLASYYSFKIQKNLHHESQYNSSWYYSSTFRTLCNLPNQLYLTTIFCNKLTEFSTFCIHFNNTSSYGIPLYTMILKIAALIFFGMVSFWLLAHQKSGKLTSSWKLVHNLHSTLQTPHLNLGVSLYLFRSCLHLLGSHPSSF